MTGVALAALLTLRAMGILAPVAVPVLVGITVLALTTTTTLTLSRRARRLPISVRVGMQVIGTTSVIYATGWGPVLSVGLGAVAKTTGAGGGDIVLVAAPATIDRATIDAAIRAVGLQPLDLAIDPLGVDIRSRDA